MQTSDLALFVALAHAPSMAEAARRMGLPPMTASRRLALLEEELGARLIQRNSRVLALTPEGRAFLPHAQALLDGEVEARASVRPPTAGASGLLRVTTSIPFGRRVVAPFIPHFARANPDLNIELVLSDEILDIVGQGMDLAIRIADLRESALIARKIAHSPRALYAAPDYLARRGLPTRAADLAGHDCLTVCGITHWTLHTATSAPVKQRVAGRFSANSPEALHQACLGGMGIALLSTWIAADDVASGALTAVPLAEGAPTPFAVWAVHPSQKLAPAKVRLFSAALQHHLATDRAAWFGPSP